MKRKLPAFLEAVILSLLCAWSGAGCLISAFSLRLSAQQPVLLTWLLWALLCGVLLFRRWGGALLLAVAGLGGIDIAGLGEAIKQQPQGQSHRKGHPGGQAAGLNSVFPADAR